MSQLAKLEEELSAILSEILELEANVRRLQEDRLRVEQQIEDLLNETK